MFQAILTVMFNQTILSLPVVWAFWPLLLQRGFPDVHELPPIHIVAVQIIGCVFFEELGFYYTHR